MRESMMVKGSPPKEVTSAQGSKVIKEAFKYLDTFDMGQKHIRQRERLCINTQKHAQHN